LTEQYQATGTEEAERSAVCSRCGAYSCDHRQDRTRPTLTDLPTLSSRPKTDDGYEFSASYEILGRLGEGGMSIVFKGRHRILHEYVAIKMLHSHLIQDSTQIKRFQQEAQALFRIEHPNIIHIRDFGVTTDGAPFIIMEFLEGRSLSDEIKMNGPMPVQRALKIFMQICDGLQHAHEQGIVHRDIKPSNIILTKDKHGNDVVKIVDFGIAKLTQEHGDVNPGLTQTGDVFGSPLYMSPEQCMGHKLDARTDMYALGCVMYETLSGHPPLVAETALATIHKHVNEMPEPLKIDNCDSRLLARLDEIIFQTLEKQPDKRYKSLSALGAELKEVSEATVFRRNRNAYVRYARWQRKLANQYRAHPALFISSAVTITAILISTAFAVAPLLAEPSLSIGRADWVWSPADIKPTDRDSLKFEDQFSRGDYVVSFLNKSEGYYAPQTIESRRKLAVLCMQHGRWQLAIDQMKGSFNHLREQAGRGPIDTTTADLALLLGDCSLELGKIDDAAIYYKVANRRFTADQPTAGHASIQLQLKLAYVAMRQHGMSSWRDVRKAIERLDSLLAASEDSDADQCDIAFKESASGDADLYLVMALQRQDPSQIQVFLPRARKSYEAALVDWVKKDADDRTPFQQGLLELKASHVRSWAQQNVDICYMRLADTYLIQKDYRAALAAYRQAERFGWYGDIARDRAFQRTNEALLNWRCGNWWEAIVQYHFHGRD
jgi:serine/threonine protein kinase